MINIIVTVDYEIFGDGTGDVRDNLVKPMEEIRTLCNRFGIKLTIFFDICEYWAFKKAEEQNLLGHLGYSPSDLIKGQLEQLINEGHDIQLHLHPQWLGASYVRSKWQLNLSNFRLADMSYVEIKELLFRAKHALETMFKPFNPDYECIAFRAGAFSVQPSMDLIRALNETGILIDSSVIKGNKSAHEPFRFNFREAYSSFKPWWVKEDILRSVIREEGKILEVPIYAKRVTRLRYFLSLKIKFWLGIKQDIQSMYPKEYSLSQKLCLRDKFSIAYLKYLFDKMVIVLDFCELSGGEMIYLLKEIVRKKDKESIDYLPLVMIGHPKLYNNRKNFEKFLRYTYNKFVKNGLAYFGAFHDLKSKF